MKINVFTCIQKDGKGIYLPACYWSMCRPRASGGLETKLAWLSVCRRLNTVVIPTGGYNQPHPNQPHTYDYASMVTSSQTVNRACTSVHWCYCYRASLSQSPFLVANCCVANYNISNYLTLNLWIFDLKSESLGLPSVSGHESLNIKFGLIVNNS